ncbi:MAG: hypothetical protein WBM83_16340 [Flavobacteriaceae bacterium]
MGNLNKNSGFKTPENYFEDFTGAFMQKLDEKETTLPKQDGFIVPEDYFENLNEKIVGQIKMDTTKVIELHPFRKFYYAAASIAAIALVLLGLNNYAADEVSFEQLAQSDIEAYFESNDFDLSSYEIAEVLPVDDLEVSDILESRLSEENVIEYLNDNIDTIEELNLYNDE